MIETVSVTTVPRYKAHVRGKLPKTAGISKLIKAEFDSSLKLDGDSRAFSSDQFAYGPLDRLADCGIVPLIPKVTLVTRNEK